MTARAALIEPVDVEELLVHGRLSAQRSRIESVAKAREPSQRLLSAAFKREFSNFGQRINDSGRASLLAARGLARQCPI
jgi:hypothetical protein